MRSIRPLVLLGLLVVQIPIEVFRPFEAPAYRLVNSVSFSPDDGAMYFALLYRDVLRHRGRPDSSAAELGVFVSKREGDRWGEPELLPFSGQHVDYEPALSPDGSLMLFNSRRPYPDGRIPTRNDLWMVERRGESWGEPRPLDGINSFELEESYSTIDRDRRVVYVRGPTREGGDDYDLYETRIDSRGVVDSPRRLPFSGEQFGEGDPQLARDGSFLILTRWDHRIGWQQTCDLYLSFRSVGGWTEPVPLTMINTPDPDYGAALSSDGAWLYYRAGGRFLRRALAPIIESARVHRAP
ncbi:MAG: hypothetical protein ACKVZ0_20235 [Gemmatimonadales bacterium]